MALGSEPRRKTRCQFTGKPGVQKPGVRKTRCQFRFRPSSAAREVVIFAEDDRAVDGVVDRAVVSGSEGASHKAEHHRAEGRLQRKTELTPSFPDESLEFSSRTRILP
jgi:hypothetical protein